MPNDRADHAGRARGSRCGHWSALVRKACATLGSVAWRGKVGERRTGAGIDALTAAGTAINAVLVRLRRRVCRMRLFAIARSLALLVIDPSLTALPR